jgi:hypothetical protein
MQPIRKPAFFDLAEFYQGELSGLSTDADVDCYRPTVGSKCAEAAERNFQTGLLEGLKQAEENCARQISEQKDRFDEYVAAEKEIWFSIHADHLIVQLEQGLRLISSRIEENVASLLKPWLMHQESERVLSELVASIQRATKDAARIHVQGPGALLKRLEEKLADRDVSAVMEHSEEENLILSADDTIIEFNLACWRSNLEDAMR